MHKSLLYILSFISFLQPQMAQEKIDVQKIWKDYTFSTRSVSGFNFMNDGRHYTRRSSNLIIKYDLTTGLAVDTLFDGARMTEDSGFSGLFSRYQFSQDENYLILESERESIYRRSSKAYFYIYDRNKDSIKAVKKDVKVMYASLSPDSKKLAYVYDNNLYCQFIEQGVSLQITSDGKMNEIINGNADWVYEEEFSMSKAFEWSADSEKIAYLRFDEREVPEFIMTNYKDELYPEYVKFKYPKVGAPNSKVSAHIHKLSTGETIKAEIVEEDEDIYLPRIKWTNDENTLFVYKLNRHQNHLEVLAVDALSGEYSTLIDEKNNYYIDITDDIRFLDDGEHFIWSSEKSGYNHLYLYNMQGQKVKALSSGEYDVTQFYGIDEQNGEIYYQAAETSPMQRQIYAVSLSSGKKRIVAGAEGSNNAQFSSTFDYYVNTHSTINTPPSYKVYDRKGNMVRMLEDNSNVNQLQKDYGTSPVEFFDFKTSENVQLNGYMIKPPNMDPAKTYPVFMYVYGGPGSQNVIDSWKGQNYWWFQMLAQNGFIVACVDNRGTGGRGEKFKKMTYMNLGHYETIDQIEAARYLGSLAYTDPGRIGIFGWSYGGYMSSLCLLKGNDVFKAAIAVAPVTNWKWYDTIYTERYMRTEEENPEGYKQNSPVYFADRLRGDYLLVHGMGDDNVHFQHTAEMANALIRANKQFETYYYPNRNHGIYGGVTREHLYTKMTSFLEQKLKRKNSDEDRP